MKAARVTTTRKPGAQHIIEVRVTQGDRWYAMDVPDGPEVSMAVNECIRRLYEDAEIEDLRSTLIRYEGIRLGPGIEP